VDTVSKDAADKNITLIAKRIVSGKVSLPKGVAPEGGIKVEVIVALNNTKIESTTITILKANRKPLTPCMFRQVRAIMFLTRHPTACMSNRLL